MISQVSPSQSLLKVFMLLTLTSQHVIANIPMIDTKTGSILYNSQTATTTPSSTINYCYSIIGTFNSILLPNCESNILNIEDDTNCYKITCPHASLSESSSSSSSNSVSSISSISSSMIITGLHINDVKNNLLDKTRFGRSLNSIFVQSLSSDKKDTKQLLLFTIEDLDDDADIQKDFMKQLGDLFDICVLSSKGDDNNALLQDYFDIELVSTQSKNDAQSVIEKAKEYASNNSSPSSNNVILSNIIQKYNSLRNTKATVTTDPPIITESQYIYESAYLRQIQSATNRFTSWKNRIARGLTIDKYGVTATTLYKRTLSLYDRETLSISGISTSNNRNRYFKRQKLEKYLSRTIQELYYQQIDLIDKLSLQSFQSTLIQSQKKTKKQDKEYDENAAMIRSTMFAYDTQLSNMEIPTLNLFKTKHIQTFEAKLYNTLSTIDDTNQSQLMKLDNIQSKSNKSKGPKDKSINVGVSLVSMIRPDGFGNMQGFVGYNLGPHSVTVGYHNDADAPETISQFGGVKPPLLRIQPKLNFDIEL